MNAPLRPAEPALTPAVGLAVLLDAVAVLAFVTMGRSSHAEGITIAGVASTAWPFLVGAAVGWVLGRLWRAPLRVVPGALVCWVATVAVGMGLRALAGQGTAASFVIVATLFLGATLVGWRLVVAGIPALRRRFVDAGGVRGSATGTGDS